MSRPATRRSINVKISPSGEITVEAHGFTGRGCEAATAAIEAALGQPVARSRKPEYWRQEQRGQNTQRLGGGGTGGT